MYKLPHARTHKRHVRNQCSNALGTFLSSTLRPCVNVSLLVYVHSQEREVKKLSTSIVLCSLVYISTMLQKKVSILVSYDFCYYHNYYTCKLLLYISLLKAITILVPMETDIFDYQVSIFSLARIIFYDVKILLWNQKEYKNV